MPRNNKVSHLESFRFPHNVITLDYDRDVITGVQLIVGYSTYTRRRLVTYRVFATNARCYQYIREFVERNDI